jgi:hypothetical protein
MTWPAPDPENDVPCPFFRCWIGPCGETDRSKCRHSRDWVKSDEPHKPYGHYSPFGRQRDDRCSCGRPALSECECAGSLVCGAPICHIGDCTYHGGRCP